jgi:hypothetical protein
LKGLIQFLQDDPCDRCGDPDTGCVERATCLTDAARAKGYDAWPVHIKSTGRIDHKIVAFPTSDNGTVFIEPLYDRVVTVKVGENYLKQFGIPGTFIPSGVFILK